VTVPLPAPTAPPVIVIHPALLTAVHAQVPADAATFTLPLPAGAGGHALDDDNVNVHVGGGPMPGWLMYASSNQKKSFSDFTPPTPPHVGLN
jgi:hypothetical protein